MNHAAERRADFDGFLLLLNTPFFPRNRVDSHAWQMRQKIDLRHQHEIGSIERKMTRGAAIGYDADIPQIATGARLGSYEIIAPVGTGGMGEVYRARDVRLNRDIAVKVLPASLASDPDALARFEREARAVAALSHPNILSIYDFGSETGIVYAVMELLEGETLRSRLESSHLASRKAVDLAVQIAHALAAAHARGIVHRDLKPENVFITRDGHVKVLDFGLARVVGAPHGPASTEGPTRLETKNGIVLGTVGYMSPEQVRGLPADHRSDIFSFGIVLYEMLAGRRPFGGDSAVEAMNAILKESPAPLELSDSGIAPALGRITEHCLEKEPDERFQSARDLAFDLEALRTASDAPGPTRLHSPARRRMSIAPAGVLVLIALAIGVLTGRWSARDTSEPAASPDFTRLTYDRGTVWNGRFAPDGQNVVYGAAWDGGPIRTFLSRTDRPGSTSLNLPNGSLLAISSSGEMAISLGHAFEGWMGEGTLARVQLFGSGPRAVAEHVREADWSPDGADLAIVRRVNGRERLELPIGTALCETSGYISHIRISRDGQRIAFADHPLYADDNGDIAVVDRSGSRRTLATGFQGLRGVAWSPDDTEVWFTAMNSPHAGVSMRAASLDGRTRTVLSLPTDWRILDVAKDGRLLISGEVVVRHVELRHEGDPRPPQELASMFEQATGTIISDDGKSVLITDQGGFAGAAYATYLRHLDQPAPVRLGEGQALGFSPDGRFVLSVVYGPPSRLFLLPTGVGQAVELANPQRLTIPVAAFLPDGKHVVYIASEGSKPLKGFVHTVADGNRRPFTAEGVNTSSYSALPITPDGSGAWLLGADGKPYLFPINGGEPQPLRGVLPDDDFVTWSADGRALYVLSQGTTQRVYRVDLATGSRTVWKDLIPSQPAGVRLSQLAVTPDGKTMLHSYSQLLSNLYVVSRVTSAR